MNPDVRVAYSAPAYEAMRAFEDSLTPASILVRTWQNRLQRWFVIGVSKEWIVQPRVRRWLAAFPENREDGAFCLLNEMHVLTTKSWRNV